MDKILISGKGKFQLVDGEKLEKATGKIGFDDI